MTAEGGAAGMEGPHLQKGSVVGLNTMSSLLQEARAEAARHGLRGHHHWTVVLYPVCGRLVSLRKGAAQRAGAPHHVGPSGDDGTFPEFGSRRLVTVLKIQSYP